MKTEGVVFARKNPRMNIRWSARNLLLVACCLAAAAASAADRISSRYGD
jgi:hypothetical protein